MKTKTPLDEILCEAERLGVGIALAPDNHLEIFPAAKVPRDFLAAIRERKGELRTFLESRAPWLHTAKQILLGEFDGASRATRERLVRGLRDIPHPQARSAMARLQHEAQQI
jgi:sugar phosphate isomerase/epimerase